MKEKLRDMEDQSIYFNICQTDVQKERQKQHRGRSN